MKFPYSLVAGLAVICTLATSRAQWDADAWPSCEHSGKTFMPSGVMYRQVWAGDMFNALSERASVVYTNGWEGLTGGVSTNWWRTYTGVTNRVVRNEREVLAFMRQQTGLLIDEFINPSVTNTLEYVNDQFFEHTFVDREFTYFGGCSMGSVQEVTEEFTYTLIYTKGETNTAYSGGSAYIGNRKHLMSDEDFGPYYADEAQVPHYFFEQDVLPSASSSYLTPNRLRGGLCFAVTNMPGYEVVFPPVAVESNVVEVIAISSSNAADIDASAVIANGTTNAIPSHANPTTFYRREILDDETLSDIATNIWHDMTYTDAVSINITNSSAFIATNVVVRISISSNVEVQVVSGNLASLNWANWKRTPVVFRKKTMNPSEVATYSLVIRFNRDPGESPRANQKWYTPDYGWDGLRRVVNAMDKTVWHGDVDWYWPESSENYFEGISEEEFQPTNTWAEAKAAAEDSISGSVRRSESPSSYSRGAYGFEGDCDAYAASFYYAVNKASVTNVELYVEAPSFTSSVYAYEHYEGVYSSRPESYELVLVGTGSGSASFFTAQIGGDSITWISDPSDTRGFPESGFQNLNYIERTWASPFAVMTWDFDYND